MSPDEASVLDMLGMARTALQITDGMTKEGLLEDTTRRLALERALEVVGEAARRVSTTYREAHPEVPWHRAAGLRDVISREYDRIDYDIIWNVATVSIPELIDVLIPLVPPAEET